MNFSSELKHQDLAAAKDGVESACIDLSLSSWPVEINTLQDSENLITASLDYTGTLDWQTSQTGGVAKVISTGALAHCASFYQTVEIIK